MFGLDVSDEFFKDWIRFCDKKNLKISLLINYNVKFLDFYLEVFKLGR